MKQTFTIQRCIILLWIMLAQLPNLFAQTVSTLTGIAGESFNTPAGIAVDGSGNVYVADNLNQVVRKISPAGIISTLAGRLSASGSTDATGGSARFNSPTGVAVDASGNVFVTDCSNHTIRKITPAGVVTTFAGFAGSSGNSDGTGSGAAFNRPYGITIDGSDNLYVTDSYNHRIRKITPTAVVTTLAGSSGGFAEGTGPAALFSFPRGIAVDGSGNVYVSDQNNNRIRVITPAGVTTTLAGNGTYNTLDGTGTAAAIKQPEGITVNAAGTIIYVASDYTIRQITSAGVVTTLAGVPSTPGLINATGSAARFSVPTGLAITAGGDFYAAEQTNNLIRKITPAGVVTTFAGTQGSVDGSNTTSSFARPHGVTVDPNGNIYVADNENHSIRKITPSGTVSTFSGGPATFNLPTGVASDISGNIYVADQYHHIIHKITPAGIRSVFAGSGGASSTDGTGASASFNQPTGVVVDASGNVYVTEYAGNRIRKITPAAVVTTLAGTFSSGSADGTGASATFNRPYAITVDLSGYLYVADQGNHRIRKITSGGVVTTLAGSTAGYLNGNNTGARFNEPSGITIDAAGNLYVADKNNHVIRMVTASGMVSTFAGTASPGFADGAASSATFYFPVGIVTNGAGTFYIGDAYNNKIRQLTMPCASTIPSAPTASTTVQPTCATPTGTIEISAPLGAYQYSMDGITYQTSTTFEMVPPGAGYTFTARNAMDNACISTASSSVSVNSAPSLPATPTASTTVQPTCSIPTGTIEITAPTGAYEYSIDGSTYQSSVSFTGVAPSAISVTARSTSDPSCISIASSVTVNPVSGIPTAPTVSVTVQPTIAVPTGTAVITAPTGSVEYSVDGGAYQASTTFNLLAPGSHSFTARSTTDINCVSGSANVTVNAVPTSVMDSYTISKAAIYPNPAVNEAYFRLSEEMKYQSSYKLVILDATGKQVEVQQYESAAERLKLPIENLKKGIYQIIVSSGDRTVTDRLVVL